jgi:hypothetical protein
MLVGLLRNLLRPARKSVEATSEAGDTDKAEGRPSPPPVFLLPAGVEKALSYPGAWGIVADERGAVNRLAGAVLRAGLGVGNRLGLARHRRRRPAIQSARHDTPWSRRRCLSQASSSAPRDGLGASRWGSRRS